MTDHRRLLDQPNSWLSPHLETRKDGPGAGNAVYATTFIKQGELLAMWGGTIVTYAQLKSLPSRSRELSIQVEEELFLVSPVEGPGDYINHSCDPNAGLSGQIGLVAMRDIAPGEEICFDYAMSDSSDYDEFDCSCGSANCRGRISGKDWRDPTLWERYWGYFSPYLQKRIQQLHDDRMTG